MYSTKYIKLPDTYIHMYICFIVSNLFLISNLECFSNIDNYFIIPDLLDDISTKYINFA